MALLMLKITIQKSEFFDPVTETFLDIPETTLQLEHSLKAVSLWESKYHKPFLENKNQTSEELLYYVRCMVIGFLDDSDAYILQGLSKKNTDDIIKYLNDPMTATKVKSSGGRSSEYMSSELIYYYMTALNIPFECENWPLPRLIALINVCAEKQKPPKKMSSSAVLKQNAELNAARRAMHKSKG